MGSGAAEAFLRKWSRGSSREAAARCNCAGARWTAIALFLENKTGLSQRVIACNAASIEGSARTKAFAQFRSRSRVEQPETYFFRPKTRGADEWRVALASGYRRTRRIQPPNDRPARALNMAMASARAMLSQNSDALFSTGVKTYRTQLSSSGTKKGK